ncbi:MAG: sodium-dependent transporter [Calditrichaeota bacterium]|nr:MAG: sodium-dependent transporter [Calditrichota bacterium]
MSTRQTFSSKFSTILTMLGVSVGLGNVWRFPYMMGKYGGSAFLFVYLGFTVLFAIPAVMAEWALGRETRKGPIGAFSAALGPGLGRIVGYMLLFTVLVANSYYLVVIGNVLYTTAFSIFRGFTQNSIPVFEEGLGRGLLQYEIAVGTLVVSLYVIYRGLNKGIEWVSKLFVPFFAAAMVYLVVSAFSLEGAGREFLAFLKPDFAALKPSHVFAALGQAFFSLGLGGTFLLIYGSYLKEDQEIPRAAIMTGLGDAGAALNASLFIIPSILVFGLDLTSGPKLIFYTLPRLFSVMPAGQLLGSLFLVALSMVAFLSDVAALEVLVGGLNDGFTAKWTRTRIIVVVGLLEALLMLPSALHPNLIGVLDLVFGSGMQIFGSTLAVIGLTWGLGKMTAVRQIFDRPAGRWHEVFYFWLRWVIPGTLLLILGSYIYSSVTQ